MIINEKKTPAMNFAGVLLYRKLACTFHSGTEEHLHMIAICTDKCNPPTVWILFFYRRDV